MTAPTFADARGRREKARSAGLSPDYWYAVEYDRAYRPGAGRGGDVLEPLHRPVSRRRRRLRAIENRCAHRQLKLSLGRSTGCTPHLRVPRLVLRRAGRLVDIPHDLFGRPLPIVRVATYPVRVRYGLVWLFPGDPALADASPSRRSRSWRARDRWAVRAHRLHLAGAPLDDHRQRQRLHPRLPAPQVPPVRGRQAHALRGGRGRGAAALRRQGRAGEDLRAASSTAEASTPTPSSSAYEYPYQWSNTGDRIKHWCSSCPIDERTTRVFFVFYFDAQRLPFTPVRMPAPSCVPLLGVAKRALLRPLLSQDGARRRGGAGGLGPALRRARARPQPGDRPHPEAHCSQVGGAPGARAA